jgi:uncharacterized surface protein with fasciclin (FAS1) repeats
LIVASATSADVSRTGFLQAFDTDPTWSFTFFAPSNAAFENLGEYFTTYAATAKGKQWLGNLLTHHYVPNSSLKSTVVNNTLMRVQSGNYNFISAQKIDGTVTLNNVAQVTEADIPVTSVSEFSSDIVDRAFLTS